MDVTIHDERDQADAPDDESFRIWVITQIDS